MHYEVTTRETGYRGIIAGVTFHGGRGVASDADVAALAYFNRKPGYTVTPLHEADRGHAGADAQDPPPEAPVERAPGRGDDQAGFEQVQDASVSSPAPERPSGRASQEVWARYVAATTDLSEAEAAELSKADLVTLATENKENN